LISRIGYAYKAAKSVEEFVKYGHPARP